MAKYLLFQSVELLFEKPSLLDSILHLNTGNIALTAIDFAGNYWLIVG